MLTVKLTIRKNITCQIHKHVHDCAQQKKLWYLLLNQCRHVLEEQKDDPSEPFCGCRWEFGIKMFGLDDKPSIRVVSDPNCPVAAMAYKGVHLVVPANTEIHSANHDFPGTGKLVSSVSSHFNIGKNPSKSLLSEGVDGNGRIYVFIHKGVSRKSDNYRNVASGICRLREQCITMLVKDKLFYPNQLVISNTKTCALCCENWLTTQWLLCLG